MRLSTVHLFALLLSTSCAQVTQDTQGAEDTQGASSEFSPDAGRRASSQPRHYTVHVPFGLALDAEDQSGDLQAFARLLTAQSGSGIALTRTEGGWTISGQNRDDTFDLAFDGDFSLKGGTALTVVGGLNVSAPSFHVLSGATLNVIGPVHVVTGTYVAQGWIHAHVDPLTTTLDMDPSTWTSEGESEGDTGDTGGTVSSKTESYVDHSGADGHDGTKGGDGGDGTNAKCHRYWASESSTRGGDGSAGTNGTDGADGAPITIETTSFGGGLFDASGGDGGDGGAGGDGGHGGNADDCDSGKKYRDGDDGGTGGSGGHGGNGGDGAKIVILYCEDLGGSLEMETSGGNAGAGGPAGEGGTGGTKSSRGSGGSNGTGGTGGSPGTPGTSGTQIDAYDAGAC